MGDIFDAMERLTAQLAQRVVRLAGERGWGARPYSSMVGDGQRFSMMVVTTVALPGGLFASFSPSPEPLGTASWPIDVRRTDGRTRPGWLDGLSMVRTADGAFVLWRKGSPLTDEQLRTMLDELASH